MFNVTNRDSRKYFTPSSSVSIVDFELVNAAMLHLFPGQIPVHIEQSPWTQDVN